MIKSMMQRQTILSHKHLPFMEELDELRIKMKELEKLRQQYSDRIIELEDIINSPLPKKGKRQ